MNAALEQEAAATFQQAESFGIAANGLGHPAEALFDDVYAAMPAHLREQLDEAAAPNRAETDREHAILPFADSDHRAAG